MSKHTPGPWSYTPNPYLDHFVEYVCYDAGRGAIASVNRHTQNHSDWRERDRAEFEANACLIALAPEMLEALKVIQKELGPDTSRLLNSLRRGDQSLGQTLSFVVEICANAIAKAEGKS